MSVPSIEFYDAVAWGLIAAGLAFHVLRGRRVEARVFVAAMAALCMQSLVLTFD